jgi:hypothetical protein
LEPRSDAEVRRGSQRLSSASSAVQNALAFIVLRVCNRCGKKWLVANGEQT